MAVNRKIADAPKTRRYTVGSGVVAGDPVVVGQIPGVALTDYSAHDAKATVQLDGTYRLSVESVDSGGTSGADRDVVGTIGSIVYYGVGDDPKLSLRAGGIRFGYLATAILSGATASVDVQIGY